MVSTYDVPTKPEGIEVDARRISYPIVSMKYRWVLRETPSMESVTQLSSALNDLPRPLTISLLHRGIDTLDDARLFFRPSLDALHDPFLMADIHEAVERILSAREMNERVLVYGDYDVDGTTSVALLVSFLDTIGVDTDYFVPDRIKHGYGLSKPGIDFASERKCSLIITLDCGITAIEEASYAASQSIDMIICDHHTPPETLPQATAILNPKRVDCPYPFKDLSACGVGLKLVQALSQKLSLPATAIEPYLDLVALSIGADIVPVESENRTLMSLGIDRIRKTPRTGIRQLAIAAGLHTAQCSTGQVVFGFAPRINAAGRVDSARTAVDLLLSTDVDVARRYANILEELNDRRRALDQSTLEQASAMAERMFLARERHGVVLYDDRWHPGVIGITASRIVEQFYRPAVMLTCVDGVAKGSARSIHGLNIYDVLSECSDLLIQFGGHDYAAGMSLELDAVDDFRERFNEEVGKRMSAELMIPAIRIDCPLDTSEIDGRFWAVLKQFEPFGPANSRPVFLGKDLRVVGQPRTMGKSQDHIRFNVRSSLNDRSRSV